MKIKSARFRNHRHRILQIKYRWKALDEIYKIYILLHRSDLNVPVKNASIFLMQDSGQKKNRENLMNIMQQMCKTK